MTMAGRKRSRAIRRLLGRAMLSEILPKGLPFKVHRQATEEEGNLKLINESFRRCGLEETVCSLTS
jgi:DNA-directed RNA polymerase subunit beta'